MPADPLLRAVTLDRSRIPDPAAFPFSLRALRGLGRLELHPEVTFLVGENGSGKSTLVEAVAAKLDLDYRLTRAFLQNLESFLRHLLTGG